MAKLTERVRFTISSELKLALQEHAQSQGITLSELLRRATTADRLAALR